MYDKILVAVDHSEISDRAVLAARDLALLSKGEVWVLHLREREVAVRGGAALTGEPEDGVSVHAIYNGTRIDGRYHPATGKLEITSGVLARQVFKTPSGAAIAVVRAHNPGVKPNRNGWTFWVVTETGKLLQSLR